jgi:hypothetical protein
MSVVHAVCGAVSFYLFVAIALSVYSTPQFVTIANVMLIGTLFITSVTSFIFVRRAVWKKLSVKK